MQIENYYEVDRNIIQIEVKKRNVERNLLPDDAVTIDKVLYVVERIEKSGHLLLLTLRVKHRPRIKFRQWLIKHRINVEVHVANSFKFNCAKIAGKPYELITPKYDYLWDKEVKKFEHNEGYVKVWLI